MALAGSSLSIVEGWMKQISDLSIQNGDPLITAASRGFEAMAAVLMKNSSHEHIQRVLAYLNVERSLSLQFEKIKNDPMRNIIHGLIQCLHLTLGDLTEGMNRVKETEEMFTQTEEESTQSLRMPLISPYTLTDLYSVPNPYSMVPFEMKEEEFEAFPISPAENEMSSLHFGGVDIKEEEMLNDDVNNETDDVAQVDEKVFNEHPPFNEDQLALAAKRVSSDEGVRKDDTPAKKSRRVKMSDTEMDCPECEFRTKSVGSWLRHLRQTHSTTPTLAGLALLCECGQESRSEHHSFACDIANFTVIRKTYVVVKGTVQCMLCEKRPKDIGAYAYHLKNFHKSSLKANGIYLTCACNFKVMSHNSLVNHSKECDGAQFTVHKIQE